MKKKTKIIATIGPASGSKEKLIEMKKYGVDVMRLNFSHGDLDDHKKYLKNIKEIREGEEISILQDLPGPKIRVGDLKENSINIESGDEVYFTVDPKKEGIPVNYSDFIEVLDDNSEILIDDGTKKVQVKEKKGDRVLVKVKVGGRISSHKGINLPGVKLKEPAFTKKDRDYLKFGIENKVDMVAISFVESADDIREVKEFLKENDAEHIRVIAKIERQFAVDDIVNILEVADGIMVARGDMGLQMAFEKIPFIQKKLIRDCKNYAKPVITATHMLESMVESPQPTRAEVSDVTNAVLNGTDAVMLSEETAVGKYPVETIKVMRELVKEAETELPPYSTEINEPKHVPSAMALSAVKVAQELDAKAIFVLTESGSTARLISRYRPKQEVYALSPNRSTLFYLNLNWGVEGVRIDGVDNIKEAREVVRETANKKDVGSKGDYFVMCAGMPFSVPGTTNLVFVDEV